MSSATPHVLLSRRGLLLATAVLLSPGCARQSAAPPRAGSKAAPSLASPAVEHLRVGLTEWSIQTSSALLRPGTVTATVTNAGGTGHDLVVTGAAGTWATPVLAPGESHHLRLVATAGEELDLVCTLGGHHAAGMHTTLRVAQDDP